MIASRAQRILSVFGVLLCLASCEKRGAAPVATGAQAGSVPIHGHRGARGLRPENTLPAFELALDMQLPVLELDLQLSRDGHVVIWHDPFIQAGICRTDGPLKFDDVPSPNSKYSLSKDRPLDAPVVNPDVLPPLHPALAIANQRSDQLRKLRCDRNPYAERFDQLRTDDGDYGIITLDELLKFVSHYAADPDNTAAQRANANSVQFNIELKRVEVYPTFIADRFDGTEPALFERALYDVLKQHGVLDRTIVQSFDHRSLWAFAKLSDEVRLAALQRKRDPAVDLPEIRKRGADIWSPDHELLTAENVAAAHDLGLLVIPWTVNDPARARELIGLGIDGLITDRPDRVHGVP